MFPVLIPFLGVLAEEIIAAGIIGAASGAMGGLIASRED